MANSTLNLVVTGAPKVRLVSSLCVDLFWVLCTVVLASKNGLCILLISYKSFCFVLLLPHFGSALHHVKQYLEL